MRSAPSVLAIFAHPDDAELSCFGTLAALAAAGSEVHVLTLTTGSRSVSPLAADRVREATAAAALVGVTLIVENFADGRVETVGETFSVVERHLRELRPEVVVTHYSSPHFGDDHQDHQVTGRVATTLAKRMSFVRLVLHAEPPVVVSGFTPNLFVNVTETVEKKLAAIAQYQSEAAKPYMREEAVLARGRFWAMQAKFYDPEEGSYYESFQLVKARMTNPGFLLGLTGGHDRGVRRDRSA
jgi:LmbE family N-acetylglucosaminyl deacetylase